MRAAFIFFVGIAMLFLTACRNDFNQTENYAYLQFSKDTVFLDTVFTNISSSTYGLKVYNRSSENITIPSIRLGRGESSYYRLNVDGNPGKQFQNVGILAKDSIYIFIEATIDYEVIDDPLYIDSLVFDNGIEDQDVTLITLVKDAHFLFKTESSATTTLTLPPQYFDNTDSSEIQGFYINNITEFTNEKPYVIYGHGVFPENSTITIEPGTQFYFHANSGLVFSGKSSVNIFGNLDEKVVFQGDRLEPQYADLPGQWTGLWFQEGNHGTFIEHTIIKNASVGLYSEALYSDNTMFEFENIEIYNCSDFGLLARNSEIDAKNMVINNCGNASLAIVDGGTYSFQHVTLANFWNQSIRQFPTVYISNYDLWTNDGPSFALDVSFKNSIIEGNQSIEMELDKKEGNIFNHYFENTLIRFYDPEGTYQSIPEYNFLDTSYYRDIFLNEESDFKDPINNELFIGINSFVIGKGNINTTLLVPVDLLGKTRQLPADLGAYEHFDFNN